MGYDEEEAKSILRSLVTGCLEGAHRPLCYAPMTSDKYAEVFEKSGQPWADEADDQALQAACKQWETGDHNHNDAEGITPPASLAWRDQDAFEFGAEWHRWAREVARPLRAWFKPKSS